jgi:hypothetical protein
MQAQEYDVLYRNYLLKLLLSLIFIFAKNIHSLIKIKSIIYLLDQIKQELMVTVS